MAFRIMNGFDFHTESLAKMKKISVAYKRTEIFFQNGISG